MPSENLTIEYAQALISQESRDALSQWGLIPVVRVADLLAWIEAARLERDADLAVTKSPRLEAGLVGYGRALDDLRALLAPDEGKEEKS